MILKGKRVIVTGGSGYLGRELVSALTAAGAEVGVFDLNSDQPGAIAVDLTDPRQVESAVANFAANGKPIDVLVNNAGIIFSAPLVKFHEGKFEKHDFGDWDRVLRTNLSSAFYVTACAAEIMLSRRTPGVIINVCSISSKGNAGQSAYSAAKAGLTALTTTWAKELGPLGVRCAGISPGFMDTPSTRKALSEKTLADIQKRVPLRRLGTTADFAAAVMSIIGNDYFNGKILELDGGLTL